MADRADGGRATGRRPVRQVGAAIERGRGQFLQLRRQTLRQGRQQGDEQRQGRHDDCQRRGQVRRNAWKGNLLNPDDGKTYSGVITLVGADGLNLKGCALGIICEGETWRRAN